MPDVIMDVAGDAASLVERREVYLVILLFDKVLVLQFEPQRRLLQVIEKVVLVY